MSRLCTRGEVLPSKSRTPLLDDQSDEVQDESQKEVFIGNEGSDSDDDTRHEEFLNSIRRVVVRCTLAQPKDTDDWRKITIFHTWIKNGGKNCKIIVDSRSCINVVSSSLVSKIGFKTVPHLSHTKLYGLMQHLWRSMNDVLYLCNLQCTKINFGAM